MGNIRYYVAPTISINVSFFVVGISYGMLIAARLPSWITSIMTTFAGSLDFVCIGLILADTPLSSITFTTLIIKILGMPFISLAKIYAIFRLYDESYVTATATPKKKINIPPALLPQSGLTYGIEWLIKIQKECS
ncbi:branched chain amino acid exporter, large subunit [Corynebacterium kutscheri]|uniref:AzlC protein n=1 Tax=Corynebacterium kutscheri TaxID=35755 RepID=A0A0F6TD12_9CORY|nr:AzlC family ABC transporter permease [Corynebacterium kutscheri]AKE40821.1 AzlC protein [Corynebacterium kutscheri]VEH06524.1 branched chain amino acid exporter, large subunit [Corynebacterium kutscheri]VEH09118.1 branched chain amino acid exporter, large subunit [Corynebacterium kutscheri]VEH82442.1 branched chain amino acid exporter, large subunit [Corynebacterium kutscheri]